MYNTRNATIFDVLIVYSEGIATSASLTDQHVITPFPLASPYANYNKAYAYFLDICAKRGLRAAFTTSADIIGSGTCKSYWLYENNMWIKIKKTGSSLFIFDKFSPINKKQRGKRIQLFSHTVKPFNDTQIFSLFFDKFHTFTELSNFMIPTVTIKNGEEKNISSAFQTLQEQIGIHPSRNDFAKSFILKDRYGAGGNNIYKICPTAFLKTQKIMAQNKDVTFILQPLARFDKGFSYKSLHSSTDIRLIFYDKKIIQTYIRIAKEKDFRCNEHQGGTLIYLSLKDIPKSVVALSHKIVAQLNNRHGLFALDFIISNNGNIYLMEGNTSPGIDWDLSLKKNERMSKKLIRTIVKEFSRRIKKDKPLIDQYPSYIAPYPALSL